MNKLGIVRLRAIIGVAFSVVGVVIIVELLAKPGQLKDKMLGIAFAGVLVALGIVRVRMYLAARRAAGE